MNLSLINSEDEEDCLAGLYLSKADRYIFWIGGAITFFVTTFILLGYYRYQELRKQPGDLIMGIALSNVFMSIQWLVISTWYRSVDDHDFLRNNRNNRSIFRCL